MIKKVAEASSSWMKPLQVGHVTVFTKEEDYQGKTECTSIFHFPIRKVVPAVLQMFQTESKESWEDQKLVSISIRG